MNTFFENNNLAILYFIASGIYFWSGWIFLGFWRASQKLNKANNNKYLFFGLLNFSLTGFSLASAFIESATDPNKIYLLTSIKWAFAIPLPINLFLFGLEIIGIKNFFYKYGYYIYLPLSLCTYLFFFFHGAMVQENIVTLQEKYLGFEYSELQATLGLGLFSFLLFQIIHLLFLTFYWFYSCLQSRKNLSSLIYFTCFISLASYEAIKLFLNKNFTFNSFVAPQFFSIIALLFVFLFGLSMIFEIFEVGRQAKQKSKTLTLANEEISFLMGTISHDVNSPLLTIRSFVEILEKKLPTSKEKLEHYLKRIHLNADHIKQLLKDLADYAKIGYIEEDIEKINITHLINQAITILNLSHHFPNIKINVIGQCRPVLSSQKRLKEIIINLIQNSLKYVPENNGKINIQLVDVGKGVLLRFEDNGVGIPPDLHQKVFEKFFRHDPKHPGTGMGLTIVKKAVETFHGKVWIDPTYQKGTCVCVYLPDLEISNKAKSDNLKTTAKQFNFA